MPPSRFLPLVWCALIAPTARGDGGTVRVSERSGPYRITVFTSPVPLRAGPVDVSVLVQDGDGREHAADVSVTVRITSPSGDVMTCRATTEAATNKLFRDALFDLPTAGEWCVEVTADGPRGAGTVRFTMDAAGPLPTVPDLALWIGWPALAVAVYTVHRWLVRRKARSPSLRGSGGI